MISENKVKKISTNKILAIYLLINKYFWKTKIGPIFSIFVPFACMTLYYIIGYVLMNNGTYLIQGLPVFTSLCIIPLAIITLPAMNIEFRNSILLRKIKTSNISSFQYNLICFSYFFIMGFLLTFVMLIFISLYCSENINSLDVVDWGSYFYGLFCLSISSLSLGVLISSFLNNSLVSQLLGCLILIFTLIFSGGFLPIYILARVEAIKIIGMFSPLTYAANILNVSAIEAISSSSNSIFDFSCDFVAKNIFLELIAGTSTGNTKDQFSSFIDNLGEQNSVTIYAIWEKVLYAFVPFAFTLIFSIISIKCFKWSGR